MLIGQIQTHLNQFSCDDSDFDNKIELDFQLKIEFLIWLKRPGQSIPLSLQGLQELLICLDAFKSTIANGS